MRRKLLILASISLILLAGCEFADKMRGVGEDIEESVNNIVGEVEEAKANIEETAEDFQTAVTKVKEAKEAIDKVTGTDEEN